MLPVATNLEHCAGWHGGNNDNLTDVQKSLRTCLVQTQAPDIVVHDASKTEDDPTRERLSASLQCEHNRNE